MSGRQLEIARAGEVAAEAHLVRAGFIPVARNVRVGRDEADLVMRDPDGRTMVVVEVKTRTRSSVWPEERIDRAKQFHLRRIARTLAARTPSGTPWRIDAIGVTLIGDAPAVIVHHTNAVEGQALGR